MDEFNVFIKDLPLSFSVQGHAPVLFFLSFPEYNWHITLSNLKYKSGVYKCWFDTFIYCTFVIPLFCPLPSQATTDLLSDFRVLCIF